MQSIKEKLSCFREHAGLINNYLLIIFAFVMTFERDITNVLVMLMFLVWLIEGNYKAKLIKALNNRVVQGFALVYLMYVVGLLWTDDLGNAIHHMVHGRVKFFLLPILIYSFVRYEFIHTIISAFLLGMLVNEIASYGIFFEILPPSKWGDVTNPTPFMHHIDYSVLLALTSSILIYRLLFDQLSRTEKILHVLFFVTLTSNLFIQGGRTGQLIFVLANAFSLLYFYRRYFLQVVVVVGLFFGGILFTAYHVSDTFKHRVAAGQSDIQKMREGDYFTSWGNRVAGYIFSYEVFKAYPCFGVGTGDVFGSETEVLFESQPKIWETVKFNHHIHSQYGEMSVQFGIVGLAVLFFMIYQIYRQPQKDRYLNYLKMLILFTTIFFFFTERIIGRPIFLLVIIVLTTLFTVQDERDESTLEKK